jgi:trypsin
MYLVLVPKFNPGCHIVSKYPMNFTKFGPEKIAAQSLNSYRQLIFGGYAAPRYDFFARGALPICGASLVHPDILITAAHCAKFFSEGETFYIGATALDTSDAIDSVEVETIRIHPAYGRDSPLNGLNTTNQSITISFLHDIAILKLQRPSLATPVAWNVDPNGVRPGDSVIVLGLGDDDDGNIPDHLLEASVDIVDSATCNYIYSQYGGINNETQICAGSAGAGICFRDSGGPLLLNGVLVGVVSFGLSSVDSSCCNEGPAVYTRISGYTDFIEHEICELSSSLP